MDEYRVLLSTSPVLTRELPRLIEDKVDEKDDISSNSPPLPPGGGASGGRESGGSNDLKFGRGDRSGSSSRKSSEELMPKNGLLKQFEDVLSLKKAILEPFENPSRLKKALLGPFENPSGLKRALLDSLESPLTLKNALWKPFIADESYEDTEDDHTISNVDIMNDYNKLEPSAKPDLINIYKVNVTQLWCGIRIEGYHHSSYIFSDRQAALAYAYDLAKVWKKENHDEDIEYNEAGSYVYPDISYEEWNEYSVEVVNSILNFNNSILDTTSFDG